MNDLKAFRVSNGCATEIHGMSAPLERQLQKLIERNMETMLGIRFLATEYATGRHRGRIDSLGLDENGTPVIVEYKRSRDQNVFSELCGFGCEVDGRGNDGTKPVGLRPERWCSQAEFATETATS
ncbi:hypothetical protein [Streptomyces nigrescens]